MATQSELDDLRTRIEQANENMLLARGEIARVAEKLEGVVKLKEQMMTLRGGDGTGGVIGQMQKDLASVRYKVTFAAGAAALLSMLVGWLLLALRARLNP